MTKLYSVFITCLFLAIARGFKGPFFAFVVCSGARIHIRFPDVESIFLYIVMYLFSYLICVWWLDLAAELGRHGACSVIVDPVHSSLSRALV